MEEGGSIFTAAGGTESTEQPLRIGFVCGRQDDDYLIAKGIPEKFWSGNHDEEVCSDVAIWWYIHTHYPTVICDMICPYSGDLTAARLQSNDINLLLGYDAVSAHIEEFDDENSHTAGTDAEWGAKGHGNRINELLTAASSKVWPPAEVQNLANLKSNYLLGAHKKGIRIAPTEVWADQSETTPAEAADKILQLVKTRAWQQIVIKPVPSSWSKGVKKFDVLALDANPEPLRKYLDSTFVKSAQEVLVQEFVAGLSTEPEVRAFFLGGEFLYAVANSKHKPVNDAEEGGKTTMEVTDCCESASDSTRSQHRGRLLPEPYWAAAHELGQRVHQELLPELKGFQGQQLSSPCPLVIRCDVGVQTDGGERTHFLNEIEITPTLYLHRKFGHSQDFLAVISKDLARVAADVVGKARPVFKPSENDSANLENDEASGDSDDDSNQVDGELLESELSAATLALLRAHLAS